MLAFEQALQILQTQETWSNEDDLCDCVYQRLGYWNNIYIGETYEVRICCLYAEFEKTWPQYFKRTQAEPAHWNGESDMPAAIWHRQLATELGMKVSEARDMALEPPKGQPIKARVPFILNFGGREVEIDLARVRFR